MDQSISCELLTAVLLIATSGRIFYMKHARYDTLVLLSPIAFIISILQIIAWKADLFSVVLLLLSFITLITNTRALLRFNSHLYIDNYSIAFFVTSALIVVASSAILALLVYFRPVEMRAQNFNVIETKTRLTDSSKTPAIVPVECKIFQPSNISLNTYEPADSLDQSVANRHPVILLLTDKRGDSDSYRPYSILLAQKGYNVCTADFFSPKIKWFHTIADSKYLRRVGMIIQHYTNIDEFTKQKEFFTYNISAEFESILPIIKSKYPGRKIFIVSDAMANEAAADAVKNHSDIIEGTFNIDSIKEYSLPGFGFVEQTNPLVSYIFGVQRDKDSFIARYVALKTDNVIKMNEVSK